jgi:hydroxymethylpyrimidine/phosphomethylpyrimidine kinase
MRPPVVLTIAGNDGSGGAGIQADLKTFSALGCYGMTVLTALSIQNTQGVRSIYPISSECVKAQIQVIMEDISIDAIKIGMLHLPEIAEVVAESLKSYPRSIILDPVMIAKSGDALMSKDALSVLRQKLFPLVTLITPNLCEASVILGREIVTQRDMENGAIELLDLGPKAVVIKGGHLSAQFCADCLCMGRNQAIHWFTAPRLSTKNTHGTGCTFSSAITAFLAKGNTIEASVSQAKKYISQCIEGSQDLQIGQGKGPVHHFHGVWNN